MKVCPRCQQEKEFVEFYRENTPGHGGYNTYCKQCVRENAKSRGHRLKIEIFEAYGGAICVNCGEDFPNVLALDHINDDGHLHRKAGLRGQQVYRMLKKQGWPPGYQVLCHNCNTLKAQYPNELEEYGRLRKEERGY